MSKRPFQLFNLLESFNLKNLMYHYQRNLRSIMEYLLFAHMHFLQQTIKFSIIKQRRDVLGICLT